MAKATKKWGIGPISEYIAKHGLREKYAALDPPQIAPVTYRGWTYHFYIPDAMTDKMQLAPLMGKYHELPLLERFASFVDSSGTICDLGANFGSHTLYFAAVMKARHVHAFEPQAHLIDVIQRTLDLNSVDTVTLHQAVAGAKLGLAHLKKTNDENTGMAEFRPGEGERSVKMLPLDDVVGGEHVTGVKIDVEGMQMPVLRGMSKTIRRCAPVLWLELRPGKGEVEQPSEWLSKRGYRRLQISFRDFLFIHEDDAKASELYRI